MNKNIGLDEPVNCEEVINHKLVFSDDALVVDYLNNLLASAPAINPDSGEIHFVHLPTWARRDHSGAANAFIDKALVFGTEQSKIEAEELRKENEHLKFKTELAEIDSQVLRDENHKLKTELTCLEAQRNEMKNTLDAILTQNNDLLSKMNLLQNQLDLSEKKSIEALSKTHEASAPIICEVAEENADPVSEIPLPYDNLEPETENKEEHPFELAPQQEIIPPEFTQELPPDPVNIVERSYLEDNCCSGVAQDTLFISRTHSLGQSDNPSVDHNAAVFSRRAVALDPIDRSTKPSSKIIKQNHVKDNPRIQGTIPAAKVTPPNSSHHNKINKETDRKPDFVQQQQIEEPVISQKENPVPKMETHNAFDADEIDLEPATAPKIIVQKHMKNYVDLQNETDPSNIAKEGHAIIL